MAAKGATLEQGAFAESLGAAAAEGATVGGGAPAESDGGGMMAGASTGGAPKRWGQVRASARP